MAIWRNMARCLSSVWTPQLQKALQIIENKFDFHTKKRYARQLRQLALPRNEIPAPPHTTRNEIRWNLWLMKYFYKTQQHQNRKFFVIKIINLCKYHPTSLHYHWSPFPHPDQFWAINCRAVHVIYWLSQRQSAVFSRVLFFLTNVTILEWKLS